MRTYIIDELEKESVQKAADHFRSCGWASSVAGLYQMPLPDTMLSELQKEHLEECGPYYLAIETGTDWIRLELLVRSRVRVRCECIMYASSKQRLFAIDALDSSLQELDIQV